MKVKEELSPEAMAYRMLGRHLLSTVTRNHPAILEKYPTQQIATVLDMLMDAFCLSDQSGSVCINLSEILSSDQEAQQFLTILDEIQLLVKAPKQLSENPNNHCAFILDDKGETPRLYLQRRFCEEREVALAITHYIQQKPAEISDEQRALIHTFRSMRYENGQKADERSLNEQEKAIEGALKHSFFIITGGPGTGKTTAVAKLVECLLLSNPETKIGLAAPTGKAASRMMQSLQESCSLKNGIFKNLKQQLEQQKVISQTIHKWLSSVTSKLQRPSPTNPLELDVLIIDEASMIDLNLAKDLLRCIDISKTRLILLGDKHQLAAVGPGSVLADLTDPSGPLINQIAELTVSHRFTHDSNIGMLAKFINENTSFDLSAFRDLFKRKGTDLIQWYEPTNPKLALQIETQKWISYQLDRYIATLKNYLNALLEPNIVLDFQHKTELLAPVWKVADEFRVLAAQRQGINSVSAINRFAEQRVRQAMNEWLEETIESGRIKKHVSDVSSKTIFYPGRLIINRVNYSPLNIFNGDIGLTVPIDRDWRRYEVFFGDKREFKAAALLPEHDTAFALTIHQSQGSQFDKVAVLLPDDPESSLATRELLYTGVTRAKKEVLLFSSAETLMKACTTKTIRTSGLRDRLKEF